MKSARITTHKLVFTALMAALVYLLTLVYVPLGQSKVHFGNAASLLGALLLGPWLGGAASGVGAMLFDLTHGYGILDALVTFASKFLMAMVAGLIARSEREEGMMLRRPAVLRMVLGTVAGAATYIALYMLKTYVKSRFISGIPLDGTWAAMLSKLPATCINNGFAAVVTPLFYTAIRPPLESAGILRPLRN